ncbi:hypothetical protein M8C13_10525 [Crossiella sp. SN42]|uniref:hypothetical protein n=1 Tax=Crossiella sp. SN42 TaxID=2944808 RepID=UPI00207C1A3E|nr:hypothetical protein [Crossiella sp. SN42]MCO1576191.1 hypothetical protein [Crossiella sp. SN42]
MPRCHWCSDTGFITWSQPVPQADGSFRFAELSHPCTQGCSGWWKLPAAQRGRVVEGQVSVALPPGQRRRAKSSETVTKR